METVAHTYFPDSEYMYFTGYPDCIAALLAGKIDAYLGDEPGLKSVHAEQPKIDYIRERITNQEYSFAFRKNDPKSAALCEELNAFLAKCHQDGTIQELDDIWFGVDEDRKVVDMSDLTGDNGIIRVVTTSTDMPFSYIKDAKNVGYDIDLVVRFCRYAGYQLELGDVDFAARIPAIQSGKYDFTTDMNVTEERKEQVLFSDATSTGGVVLAVLSNGQKTEQTLQQESGTGLESLNGKQIGVQTGSNFAEMVQKALPDAQVEYYNTKADLVAALTGNKVEAFVVDEPVAQIILREYSQLTYLPDYLDQYEFAAVFQKGEKGDALRTQFNAFLNQLPAGTLDALAEKWFGEDDSKKTMPDIAALPAENGVLRLATESGYMPFEYVRDNEVVGYDMELAVLFCQANGYGLEIVDMNFDGILPAVQTGKCDLAVAGISITPERAESVLFSEPYFSGGTVMVVLKAEAPTVPIAYTSLSQMAHAHIGVQTGTTQHDLVRNSLPEAQISFFNSYPDMAAALEANKIDGFPGDELVLRLMAAENDKLVLLSEMMDRVETGFVLPKTEAGDALLSQLNAWIASIQESGELDKTLKKWTDGAEKDKTVPDYASFPAPNGTLIMATEGAFAPMNYFRNKQVVGMEIDLAAQFCQAYGYGLKVEAMNFDGILPAVQSGKVDFAAAGFTITEERKESVNFSDPYYIGGTMMAVLKTEQPTAAASATEEETFWDGIVSSFNKTFLRENRWQLFLSGIGTTMLITLLSILFGTALGFLLFMLCRNGNPVANGVTRFSLWLVQGTPMVVLLMILYYIIFGSVAISGIVVAVIGFTLTFGASVFGLIKIGVGTIDRGQYEAAYALGHSNRHTFFKIILPQAIPHVLPAYQGEIVGLIKATAIVGYIAVQDLTKMGDIVRSRTYEAFFPLIAVTVIYFVLEGLFSFAVSRVRISIDPKKRKRERILKGVKTDD